LDKRQILHTGTARSATERNTPLIITNKSLKLGALAYTFSTNGIPIPAGQEFCVNMIDTVQMKKDIDAIRAAGAEMIAVFIHWGDEYQRYPNDRQKTIARFLHKQGVELILGAHPHVLQPTQLMSGTRVNTFTIYSMGNFVSAQRKQYTDCGMILRIQLIKDRSSGQIKLGKLDYIPTYVSMAKGFRVLPVKEAMEAIRTGNTNDPAYTPNAAEQARIQQVWKETTQHMNSAETGLQVYEEK
jgi:poly-gamma-glutamate synthesis protein (capsule biosynthesis protein)